MLKTNTPISFWFVAGAAAFGFSAQADINLDFTNLTGVGNGTFTVSDVGGTPTLVDSNLNVHSDVTGSLSGLTGSFAFSIVAFGTKAAPFAPGDFTGDGANLREANGLTVSSDIGAGSIRLGQGLVFSFDLSGLTGSADIGLTDATFARNPEEWRVAFRDEGAGTPSIVFSGSGTTDTMIDTSNDRIAVYNTGVRKNNQLRSLTFDIVPESASSGLIIGFAVFGVILLRRRGKTN